MIVYMKIVPSNGEISYALSIKGKVPESDGPYRVSWWGDAQNPGRIENKNSILYRCIFDIVIRV